MTNNIRSPIVAGRFYEGLAEDLKKQIKKSFIHPLGPKRLPSMRLDQKVYGAIIPHAGYFFSGPCAAHAYLSIAEHRHSKKILLIGPSHQGLDSCFSDEDFKTPLGVMKTNKKLVKSLSDSLSIPINSRFHHNEHSLEVQIPFLQFLYEDYQLIPLMLSNNIDPYKFGKIIRDYKEEFLVIASSDFTHYGPNYSFMPFGEGSKEIISKIDEELIKAIISNESRLFKKLITEVDSTVCGYIPILFMMGFLDMPGKLLKYYSSGDILKDYNNSVGYASIIF